ncbi:MAG TPA: cellulosome anchor protein, partial [Firmicutes bacterium]|nr:cellulosome anchor protein [Bacillota bacterium]
MPRKFLITLAGVVAVTLIVSSGAMGLDAVPKVQIDNEYIRIVANAGETNTGRFSVGTTGGDPDRLTDQNKHLIYGGDDPWTSYTTIRVDNQNWVYGGETDRRAGFNALYGEMIQPPTIVEGKIESSWRLGPVQVWQILSITRSSTTGLLDTAQIEYHVENIDSVPHMVGVRLMLDTMLGANDGAPFRVDDRGITTDSVYYAVDMPQFWQAFDSLANPQVMSQGTLTGRGVTTPDRVYFTNWGSLADSAWNFDFTPGRDFQRIGEFELDSAIALFWDQVSLAPGESRSFVSYYGLGGVTIAPGELIVGVTSPAEITAEPGVFQTFSIVAYVQNDGQGDALDVVAELKLPPGLQIVGSQAKVALDELKVGETKQTGWQVGVHSIADGVFTYEVEVTARNSEPNRVRRNVQVLSPAKLQVLFSGTPGLGIKDERYEPSVFEAKAVIRNDGGTQFYGGTFEILYPLGLDLVTGQNAKRFPGTIEPGQEVSFKWLLKPKDGFSGPLPYSLRTVDERGQQKVENMFIIVPELKA